MLKKKRHIFSTLALLIFSVTTSLFCQVDYVPMAVGNFWIFMLDPDYVPAGDVVWDRIDIKYEVTASRQSGDTAIYTMKIEGSFEGTYQGDPQNDTIDENMYFIDLDGSIYNTFDDTDLSDMALFARHNMQAGDSWTGGDNSSFTVENAGTVTVPAGTFENSLRIISVETSGDTSSNNLYAPNVGFLRTNMAGASVLVLSDYFIEGSMSLKPRQYPVLNPPRGEAYYSVTGRRIIIPRKNRVLFGPSGPGLLTD